MASFEERMGVHYLLNDVRVVFCTNSMSVHALLLDSFKPKVLLIEEAANTDLADLATPMAGFFNSVEQLIFGGDHEQLGPVDPTAKANEAHSLLAKSHFTELRKDYMGAHGVSMLTECYRMLPHLLKFPSDKFYHGGLVAAPRVNQQDPQNSEHA
ncbi:hypothetical protein BCR34DRAFT_656894 [Clohesyomyces aquaticus]|uniref:Uncharacterized protein n=1 Tax=Clohesyomyces aquaticus TaxID=1231657 RepID=A0A1Y1ZGQ2_9PLEO|nr:hypothetical protein BCR34DRAFT_656894 [Clohesyomyces aquaticus]